MVDVTGLSYAPHNFALPPGDLWVFGYGSLMWNPGFRHLGAEAGRIHGFHRRLCVWSWVHRGSPKKPGLVLGLDRGGACIGRLYRVAAADKARVADYLYRREMATPVYLPTLVNVRGDRGTKRALTFTVDRAHAQYAGKLSLEEAYATVIAARGRSGENPDYVITTADHFEAEGIRDTWFFALRDRLRVALDNPGKEESER